MDAPDRHNGQRDERTDGRTDGRTKRRVSRPFVRSRRNFTNIDGVWHIHTIICCRCLLSGTLSR